MSASASKARPQAGLLSEQLRWFIALRWLAALAVIAGGLVDLRWLHWFPEARYIVAVGFWILLYNVALHMLIRRTARMRGARHRLLLLSWAQLLLDMGCLTILVLLTGGLDSPLTPFFVLHMVFASLLLPRRMAYAGAIAVITVYLGAMGLTGNWPVSRQDRLIMVCRLITLLATVHLANHITRGLRRQRRRLTRQNRRIRSITKQLRRHQETMIQHEKMVALGQMAAGVTHEIANPLASMDSLLQLIQRKPDRMRPDAVTTLRSQIDRINQIVQQMKLFAHPSDGHVETVSLNEVVDQSLDMVRFDKRLKGVEVVREYSPEVGRVPLLSKALHQVLVNLILNALDAMSQTPKPRLGLRTERRDDHCIVEVSDNGSGIAPEHMSRLFEPFFTTKPPGKGTGLGLSISYSLIQKQGGSMSVRSQAGVGTSFSIRLPVALTRPPAPRLTTPATEP